MKKILYGTTALLAAGMISTSVNAAEPISLSLGGYMQWWVASTNNDTDYLKAMGANGEVNTIDVLGDGEVHFVGDTTLDNGIKIGVKVELEGGNQSEADPVDESYVTVDTTYGRLIVGSTNNVAYQMHVGPKDVGKLDIRETDLSALILRPANVDALNTTQINTDNDAQKLSYITPTYWGFTLGTSWIPGADGTLGTSDSDGEDQTISQDNFEEGYAFGAMYTNEYQGIGINLSTGYANFNVGGKERRSEYTFGSSFSYMGFTLAGSYRMVNDPQFDDTNYDDASNAASGRAGTRTTGFNAGTGNDDGYAYDLGLAYEAGPYGISLAYMKSEVEGVQATGVNGSAVRAADLDNGEDEVDLWLLSGKYNLGAGVDTFASFGYMDYSDGDATATVGGNKNNASDNDGWAFVTGLALTF